MGQEIWLAPDQAASLNQPLSSQQLDRLATLYAAAVDEAVSNDKPICLTALFDYDERTVDRCVDAMLSPVGKGCAPACGPPSISG